MADVIRDFRDLILWQKAIGFAKQVYGVSAKFPKTEQFGLTAQLRRSAVSVSSNIAEGHARQGKEFLYFLSIARGSLAEAESQLLLSVELGFVKENETRAVLALAVEVRRIASALSRKIESRRSVAVLTPGP